jgi:glutamate/tyrosine decarboxylase-like PLP-dependent enzyme
MAALLDEPLPEAESPWEEVLGQMHSEVLSNMMHLDHPRFYAWVGSPSNYVSVMGELLATGFNVFSGLWVASPGPTQVEITVVDWLKELMGFPAAGGGLLVSGGSMANLTALAVARHVKLGNQVNKARIYCSDQTHSSNEKALRLLGFPAESLCKIPSDEHFRLPADVLEEKIRQHRREGLKPFCVIANAGTTNTGAVDPLPALYQLCQAEDLWLHVDGAYGAAARLTDQGRQYLEGIEMAHSLTLDPHKWLFQPYETGCVLVREACWLEQTFRVTPEYLRDVASPGAEVNYSNLGIQLTRSNKALKLWMSMKVFGVGAFRKAVSRGMELAQIARQCLEQYPDWQVVSGAQLGILTFRYCPPGQSEAQLQVLNQAILDQIVSSQSAMMASTILKGKLVLRMCVINPRTTAEDIAETVQLLNRIAYRLPGQRLEERKYLLLGHDQAEPEKVPLAS